MRGFFSELWFIGDIPSRYLSTTEISQVELYRGKFGLMLYTLLIKRVTRGKSLNEGLSNIVDKADLAVFKAVYPYPCLYNFRRNSKYSRTWVGVCVHERGIQFLFRFDIHVVLANKKTWVDIWGPGRFLGISRFIFLKLWQSLTPV